MSKPKYKIGQTVYGFQGGVCNRSELLHGKISSISIDDDDNYYRIGHFEHDICERDIFLDFTKAKRAFKKEFAWEED